MSEKRRQSMAVIDQTLVDSQKEPEKQNALDENLKSTPIVAPVPADEEEETAPLTADEQKVAQAQKNLLGEEEAEEQRKAVEEEVARQQTTAGKLNNLKEQATERYGDYLRAGTQRVSSLPTPGGIATPLIILIIFLFILIQIGGHTRLQWLWLVLTNNAFVGSSQSSSTPTASTSNTVSSSTPTANQQNSITLPPQPTVANASGAGIAQEVVPPSGLGAIAHAPATHFNTSFHGSGTVENWL